jgi:hypothetical protein
LRSRIPIASNLELLILDFRFWIEDAEEDSHRAHRVLRENSKPRQIDSPSFALLCAHCGSKPKQIKPPSTQRTAKEKQNPICENQRNLRIISLLSSLATDHKHH